MPAFISHGIFLLRLLALLRGVLRSASSEVDAPGGKRAPSNINKKRPIAWARMNLRPQSV